MSEGGNTSEDASCLKHVESEGLTSVKTLLVYIEHFSINGPTLEREKVHYMNTSSMLGMDQRRREQDGCNV